MKNKRVHLEGHSLDPGIIHNTFRIEMIPTEEHIKEIAELLDCGHVCLFSRTTGTIVIDGYIISRRIIID